MADAKQNTPSSQNNKSVSMLRVLAAPLLDDIWTIEGEDEANVDHKHT